LRGDLDWVVMKCLEKDRKRRYETANGLAADLQRHLDNEPVVARPPSPAYKIQKLFQRNRAAAIALLLIFSSILTATVITAAQARRATREMHRALAAEEYAQSEKARAILEKGNAEAALHFIQEEVLSQASPGANRDLTVRALFDRISQRLGRGAQLPPLVEASIRQTVGSVYTELGEYALACQHYERALSLQREHLGDSHREVLRSLYGLSMARWWNGEMTQAEPLTRQGLEASRRLLGETDLLTLQFLQAHASTVLYLADRPWPQVEALFFEALNLHRQVLGPDDPATLRLVYAMGLGYILYSRNEGMELIKDGHERARRQFGPMHPLSAGLTALLAVSCLALHQFEDGAPFAIEAFEARRSLLGHQHSLTLTSGLVLARFHLQQGQSSLAELLTRQLVIQSGHLAIENSPFLGAQAALLGLDYMEHGDLATARSLCELALQGAQRRPSANPLSKLNIMMAIGAVRVAEGRFQEAEEFLRGSARDMERCWPGDLIRFYTLRLLGSSLLGQARYSDAEPLLLQAYHGLRQQQAKTPPLERRITEALQELTLLYQRWERPDQAEDLKLKLEQFERASNAQKVPGK
jgi:eukaryotic-like serine/threonine-protein kinase